MRTVAASLLICLCTASIAHAQRGDVEISPFAGGYFSAGFQSVTTVNLLPPPATVEQFKPNDESNSGIFGVRASYDLDRRFSLEGTFGFSPAGQTNPQGGGVGVWTFGSLVDFLQRITPPPILVSVRGKDTFSYSSNAVFHWRKSNGWAPFLTGGLGAITRTAEIGPVTVFQSLPAPEGLISLTSSFPSLSQTDFSVNFGGGVKKYFTDRCGIRLDFRDYVSEVGSDTVNNMEVSLGLIFRM